MHHNVISQDSKQDVFWFLVCYAATQLATPRHIQVCCNMRGESIYYRKGSRACPTKLRGEGAAASVRELLPSPVLCVYRQLCVNRNHNQSPPLPTARPLSSPFLVYTAMEIETAQGVEQPDLADQPRGVEQPDDQPDGDQPMHYGDLDMAVTPIVQVAEGLDGADGSMCLEPPVLDYVPQPMVLYPRLFTSHEGVPQPPVEEDPMAQVEATPEQVPQAEEESALEEAAQVDHAPAAPAEPEASACEAVALVEEPAPGAGHRVDVGTAEVVEDADAAEPAETAGTVAEEPAFEKHGVPARQTSAAVLMPQGQNVWGQPVAVAPDITQEAPTMKQYLAALFPGNQVPQQPTYAHVKAPLGTSTHGLPGCYAAVAMASQSEGLKKDSLYPQGGIYMLLL